MVDAVPRPAAPAAYAELWVLSNFSFLRGASRPEELVERAKALGYSAIALTDECSHGVEVRSVDVMHSDYDCTLEDLPHAPAVRLGLRLVDKLRTAAAQRIVENAAGGPSTARSSWHCAPAWRTTK